VHAADRTDELFRDGAPFVEAGLRLPALQRVLAEAGQAIA
jgi:energy-coupling factor transport system ATP-binding protein